MSYKYHEIQGSHKLSEMTEQERAYIHNEWERLCHRESVNNPEMVFIQKDNGLYIQATRGRIAANRYCGCAGGYWSIRFGSCKHWKFVKNPFGEYDPEPTNKLYGALILENGEKVVIPSKVHTKKDVLELVKKIGFAL